MPAYYITERGETLDADAMAEYSANVNDTIDQYGGLKVIRGGIIESLEGDWNPERIIMIEFETMAALKAWYDSPEYAPLKAKRLAASTGKAIAVASE